MPMTADVKFMDAVKRPNLGEIPGPMSGVEWGREHDRNDVIGVYAKTSRTIFMK